MSGFEIAGVVLGALPLALHAIEHYRDGLSTIKGMVNYEQGFGELLVIFELAWAMYNAACERLLLPLAISEDDYTELISMPTSSKWNDAGLHTKLRTRLGPRYQLYQNATLELHKKIEKLRKKLKLDNQFLPPWIKLVGSQYVVDESERTKFFKSKWTRISGGFDLKACTRHVARIKSDVESIKSLIGDEIELEQPRKNRKRQIEVQYWIDMRDSARSICRSFEKMWSVPCKCQQEHHASIQLDQEKLQQHEHRWHLMLHFSEQSSAPPWDWRKIEIAPRRDVKLSPQPNSVVPKVRFSTPTGSMTTHSKWSQSSTTQCSSSSGTVSQISHVAVPTVAKVDDLCHALCDTSNPRVGYFAEQSWQHHVYQEAQNQPSRFRKIVSIKDVIGAIPHRTISTKEKRALAMKMALAVLQLHDTPWIDSSFGLQDLAFFDLDPPTPTCLLGKAHISHAFVNNTSIPLAQPESNGRKFSKNIFLFALGVALVELSYGTPLIDLALPSELDAQGQQTPNTELLVATRLVKDIQSRELYNYAFSAASCVQCDIGYPFDYNLDAAGFRANFIERVVMPLKEDYDEIFSEKQPWPM